MPRSPEPALLDILDAIEGIETSTVGRSFAEFEADWLRRMAVQRAIEIISEACRHLPDELLASYPEIPWARIKASGNVLRHEYHRVADDVIWSVVVDEIPALRRAVAAMLSAIRTTRRG